MCTFGAIKGSFIATKYPEKALKTLFSHSISSKRARKISPLAVVVDEAEESFINFLSLRSAVEINWYKDLPKKTIKYFIRKSVQRQSWNLKRSKFFAAQKHPFHRRRTEKLMNKRRINCFPPREKEGKSRWDEELGWGETESRCGVRKRNLYKRISLAVYLLWWCALYIKI